MKTNICLVLDMSGSMGIVRETTINGVNEQIQQAKKNARENPDHEIYFSLVTFSGDVYEPLWNVRVTDELAEIQAENYVPNGSTAMHDAMGWSLTKMSKIKADKDDAFLFILISDGEENASQHFNAESVASLRKELEASKQWTFTYMGCTKENVMRVAQQYNLNAANCAVWSNSTQKKARHANHMVTSSLGNYLGIRSCSLADGAVATSSESFYSNDNAMADFSDEGSVSNNQDALPPLQPPMVTTSHVWKNKYASNPVIWEVKKPKKPKK